MLARKMEGWMASWLKGWRAEWQVSRRNVGLGDKLAGEMEG